MNVDVGIKTHQYSDYIPNEDCIQSEKALRTYTVVRNGPIRNNRLSSYTVYDSTEKTIRYSIKTISTDIDTMMLVDYSTKNVVANVEGEWGEDVFNVNFSIYSSKAQKWLDGTMKRISKLFSREYSIDWDGKYAVLKKKYFTYGPGFYGKTQDERFALFYQAQKWYQSTVKYKLEVYSNYMPDAIYFFALAIHDHRDQIESNTE